MRKFVKNKWVWAFFGLTLLAVNPAWADKPEWAGNKREHQKERGVDRHERGGKPDYKHNRGHEKQGRHFSDRHRKVAANHYGHYYHKKRECPPGLAKKGNGCVSPGHARRWELHKPLPRDVRYFYVPNSVAVQMGPPPHGYRYVRVGTDILMIAVGTQMVVDAITDIMQ